MAFHNKSLGKLELIKSRCRPNGFDLYYGGQGRADGPGHGHIVSNDGRNLDYWREPNSTLPFINRYKRNGTLYIQNQTVIY